MTEPKTFIIPVRITLDSREGNTTPTEGEAISLVAEALSNLYSNSSSNEVTAIDNFHVNAPDPEWRFAMLDASTAHLRDETMAWMDERVASEPSGSDSPVIMYDKPGYGWFIHVQGKDVYDDAELSESLKDVPQDLIDIIFFARSLNFQWIMFDRDGEEIDELTKFMAKQEASRKVSTVDA